MQSSSSLSSPEHTPKHWFPVPKGYKFLRVLGQGGYGTVLECVKKGSKEHVAIKVPEISSLAREVDILKKLMRHNLDESNIVKYKGEAVVKFTHLLVLEKLDITLKDYLEFKKPMQLEEISTVIQQMAVALNALKSVGLIHTDLKMDNIMMVDHVKQPLRVKLIDFGLAKFRSEAKPGKPLQTLGYRAPEIILGLPFSEAIDVWSLGCVLAKTLAHVPLFGTNSEYCVLRNMIRLLGPPPQHLIRAGRRSYIFFNKLPSGLWKLKTPIEYFGNYNSVVNKPHVFDSLDEMKTWRLETNNPAEADERRECIELLKAMLQWDEKDRITPCGILNHPFITKSFLNSSSRLSACEPEPSTSQVIMVQPAETENRINLTGLSDEDSDPEDGENREDSSRENIKDGGHSENNENSPDRKSSEDSEDDDNEEINENEDNSNNDDKEAAEDSEDDEDTEESEDDEDTDDSEEDEDTDYNENDEDTEDNEDNEYDEDSEDNEDDEDMEDSEDDEDTDYNEDDEDTEDSEDDEDTDYNEDDEDTEGNEDDEDTEGNEDDEDTEDNGDDEDTEDRETSEVSKDFYMKNKEKKQKKNGFRRFLFWMKTTFFSCCCVSDVMD